MIEHMMTLTKLVWMNDDEFRDMVESVSKFKEWSREFSDHPLMKAFARDKAISYVFHSNKFENTLPPGVRHGDTYKMLSNLETADFPELTWNTDGNSSSSAANRTQLAQHLRAFNYLHSLKKLSLEGVLETHRMLMKGSVDSQGNSILTGKVRTFGVNNGVDDYMDHAIVEQNLEKLIHWYESHNGGDEMETGHKLFWTFLTIHPFQDDNGHMARLLFSYHMFRTGTPFAVCITSGKSRARNHYNRAIKRENLVNFNVSDLYTLLTYSKYLAWKNFINQHKTVLVLGG